MQQNLSFLLSLLLLATYNIKATHSLGVPNPNLQVSSLTSIATSTNATSTSTRSSLASTLSSVSSAASLSQDNHVAKLAEDARLRPSGLGIGSVRGLSSTAASAFASVSAQEGQIEDDTLRPNGSEHKFAQLNMASASISAKLGSAAYQAAVASITPPPITKIPAPVAHMPDGRPVYGVNASVPFSVNEGGVSLRWDQGTCTMGPGVNGYNAKSCSCVNEVGDWFHEYATGTITSQMCQSTYDMHVAIDAQSLGCSSVTVTQLAKDYTAPDDCCNKCNIAGDTVQLFYWPPSNGKHAPLQKDLSGKNITAPHQKRDELYGTVSNGITFVSPSVYIMYKDLAATVSCVANVGSYRQIGTKHATYLRSFHPEDVSSAKCMRSDSGAGLAYCTGVGELQATDCFEGIDAGWAPMTYADLYDPPSSESMLEVKQKCFPDKKIFADFAATLYASPQISFPADLTDADPLWKAWGGGTCTLGDLGILDPPKALGQAVALGPGGPDAVTAAGDFGPTPEPALPGNMGGPDAPAATKSHAHMMGDAPGFLSPESAMAPMATGMPLAPEPVQAVPAQAAEPAQAAAPAPVQADPGQAAAPAPVQDTPVQAVPATQNPGSGNSPNVPAQPAAAQANSNPVISDPNNVSNQQMDEIHQALAPSPVIAGNPQSNNGNPAPAAPQQPNSPAAAVANAQNVPIVLSPQQGSNTTPSPAQGQAQPVPQAAGQPAVAAAPNAQGQAPASNVVPFVGPAPQVNGQIITKQSNGNVVIGGTTIPEGQQASVSGVTVANMPDQVVVGGTAHALGPMPAPASPTEPLLANDQVVQINNGGLQVAGQTLIPGSQVSLDGHVVNYVNPSQVIEDGTTKSLTPISTANPLVIDSQTLSRAGDGGLVIAGTTVAPNSQVSVDGHVFSLAGASSVVVDGQVYSLPPTDNAYLVQAQPTPCPGCAGSGGSSNLSPGPVTLDNGMVITPAPQPTPGAGSSTSAAQAYVLPNGATISAGGSAAVISGTTYSLLPSGTGLLVNGAITIPIPSSPTAAAAATTTANGGPASAGIGGAIMSGLTSPTTSPVAFTGAATRLKMYGWIIPLGLGMMTQLV